MLKARNNLPARVFEWLKNLLSKIISLPKKAVRAIINAFEKRPVRSFAILLLVLLVLIVAGNIIRKPKPEEAQKNLEPKTAEIYNLGQNPSIKVNAKIEKSGVVNIIAQTGGIVSKVNVTEGQQVSIGTNLIYISSNYSGSNSLSVSRQIAERQNQNVSDTYQTQKDTIKIQRDLSEKNKENFQKMRDITDQSISETESLLSLNDTITSSISSNINTLMQTNINGSNDSLILQTQQLQSQFQSASNMLRNGLRNSQFQVNQDNAPTQIANRTNDLAQKQLDIQDKAIDLNKDITALQVKLARVSEAVMFPTSPIAGVVERVNVQEGQSVSPGTVIATITGQTQKARLVATVTRNVAQSISKIDPSHVTVNNIKFELTPDYISSEATDGQLFSATFYIEDSLSENFTKDSYVEIEIPLVSGRMNDAFFIPLDAVHQTQEESLVFVEDSGSVKSKAVTLGNVQGNLVEIKTGLAPEDKVILNRNIVAGDKIKI